MAPNLFLALRNVVCPWYWFPRKDKVRISGAICRDEYWEDPVPGIYRFVPTNGWFLIKRDVKGQIDEGSGSSDTGSMDPGEKTDYEPVIYNPVVHRYQLHRDFERRCYWKTVTGSPVVTPPNSRPSSLNGQGHRSGGSRSRSSSPVQSKKGKQPMEPAQSVARTYRFYRLDNGRHWVAAWDEQDRFIPGPYRIWRLDSTTGEMKMVGGPSSGSTVTEKTV